ncbi:MAG: hypothetical protein EHM78_26600 [Myxococcaceae bacterium]|nr:MAG: hypothetical protein EHM78_26600 [Myxococcaceae bacterium]
MAESSTETRATKSWLNYAPVIAFAIHVPVRLVLDGGQNATETTLRLALLWLVGINGILLGAAHLIMPAPVARAIGWQTSPFQWEVGLAGVSYGLLGVLSGLFERAFWLATIIAYSVFMLGAAVGHIRSMIRDRNFAPGNAGYMFWYDVVVPAGLTVLYAVSA